MDLYKLIQTAVEALKKYSGCVTIKTTHSISVRYIEAQ
jgi:hypothetical protein